MGTNTLEKILHLPQRIKESVKWRLILTYGRLLSQYSKTDYHKVVMSCHFGESYSCNPKYIAEALNRLYPGQFDIVLLMKKPDPTVPRWIRQVPWGTRAAQKELATARFWIYNFRNDDKLVVKRHDQIYIQTWHAPLGPKKCEGDVEEHLNPTYVEAARHDGAITDLMFANCEKLKQIFETAFWYDGPVIRCGLPRSRPLIVSDKKCIAHIRRQFKIPDGAKICLYAPTFRADYSMDVYRFDHKALLNALQQRFGGTFVLAYRLHPNLAHRERPAFLKDCIDLTGYPDQQELLAATDVLISDYSSILEDFALTGRPGFVYAPDIADYQDDRGFYYPLSARPFPVATTSDELTQRVEEFDETAYKNGVDHFFQSIGLKDDGHGDERIATIIHRLASAHNA